MRYGASGRLAERESEAPRKSAKKNERSIN